MSLSTLLKLMRISAYPTLVSNVLAAWWLASNAVGSMPSLWLLTVLLPTSSCFYLGGMVLNDFFDADIDAVERPERPIPSGNVSKIEAGFFGFFLIACGLIGVEVCAMGTGSHLLRYIGWSLAGMIVGYDAVFKRIPTVGPVGMGVCRFLNIFMILVAVNAMILPQEGATNPLGGPLTFELFWNWEKELAFLSWPSLYALGIMVYIFGVTLISGFEVAPPGNLPNAPLDKKRRLIIRIAVFFVFTGLMLPFVPILGAMTTDEFELSLRFYPISAVTVSRILTFENAPWSTVPTFLFAAIPFTLLWKPTRKILWEPTPSTSRQFVGSALGMLIPIDAVCCLVYIGIVPAFLILCLYPIALKLRRIVSMS